MRIETQLVAGNLVCFFLGQDRDPKQVQWEDTRRGEGERGVTQRAPCKLCRAKNGRGKRVVEAHGLQRTNPVDDLGQLAKVVIAQVDDVITLLHHLSVIAGLCLAKTKKGQYLEKHGCS